MFILSLNVMFVYFNLCLKLHNKNINKHDKGLRQKQTISIFYTTWICSKQRLLIVEIVYLNTTIN